MRNDDSRGYESSDRRDAPHTDYRPTLELIDSHATTLLEDVKNDTTVDPDTRRTAKRHLRELRAEVGWTLRALCDPSELPVASREGAATGIRSPTEAAVEVARQRRREREALADESRPQAHPEDDARERDHE